MNKTVKMGLALLSGVVVTSTASTTVSFVVSNDHDGNGDAVGNITSPFLDKDR